MSPASARRSRSRSPALLAGSRRACAPRTAQALGPQLKPGCSLGSRGSQLGPIRPDGRFNAGLAAVGARGWTRRLASAVLAAGCGSAGHRATGARTPVATVNERDFRIEAPATLKAGEVGLPRPQPRARPPRADHRAARTAARCRCEPTASPSTRKRSNTPSRARSNRARPGSERELRVHLAPGRYVFFCNMEGHYLGGMHTTVTVTQ